MRPPPRARVHPNRALSHFLIALKRASSKNGYFTFLSPRSSGGFQREPSREIRGDTHSKDADVHEDTLSCCGGGGVFPGSLSRPRGARVREQPCVVEQAAASQTLLPPAGARVQGAIFSQIGKCFCINPTPDPKLSLSAAVDERCSSQLGNGGCATGRAGRRLLNLPPGLGDTRDGVQRSGTESPLSLPSTPHGGRESWVSTSCRTPVLVLFLSRLQPALAPLPLHYPDAFCWLPICLSSSGSCAHRFFQGVGKSETGAPSRTPEMSARVWSGPGSNQGKFGPTVVTRDHHFASIRESPAGTFSAILLPLPKVLILLPFH